MGNSESAEMPKPLHQEASNVKVVLGSEKGKLLLREEIDLERSKLNRLATLTIYDANIIHLPHKSLIHITAQASTMATTCIRTSAVACV
jgi:hypothetical protein